MAKTGPKPRPPLERFLEKVVPGDNGCIVWTAGDNGVGYGVLYLPGGRRILAHRWSYEYYKGPIPEGLHIDHLCRNPSCVNPEHLEPVTHRINTLRGTAPTAINAAKTHCAKGHPLSGENMRYSETRRRRRCKECERVAGRERRQRNAREAKAAKES